MDRLSIVLTLMTGSVLVGGLVIIFFSLGYYTWPSIALAALIGLVLTWPVAYAISRLIKRNDPGWTMREGSRRKREQQQADVPEI